MGKEINHGSWVAVTEQLPETKKLVALRCNTGYYFVGVWVGHRKVSIDLSGIFECDVFFDDATESYFIESGWYLQTPKEDTYILFDDEVTHWAQLPDPI